MLGRTDSRRRMLLLLVTFIVIAASLVARLAYWQVIAARPPRRARLRPDDDASARRRAAAATSTTGAGSSSSPRPSTASASRRCRRSSRRSAASEVAAELVRILRLDGDDADRLTTRMLTDQAVRHPRPRPRPHDRRPRPGGRAGEGRRGGDRSSRSRSASIPHEGGGPDSTLAAQLLGFVNRDGVGQYGVEQYYQDELAGRPRIVHAQRDVAGRPIPDTAVVEDPGTPGEDIRLTIDAGLQLALEQEVLAAWAADKAKSVSAVVMDPYTGEVLAEATYPSYDGNDYQQIAADDPNRFIDPIVSSVYEPGSVFKMLTAIAGLETQTVTTQTKIKDTGILKLDGGHTHIDDADHKARGWMTFEDGVAYSRNVVAAKVALALGKSTRQSSAILHSVWAKMGFGSKTGIDLAGEVGRHRPRPDDHPVAARSTSRTGRSARASAVTPIQLATAFAAMVNGGTLVQPHVVKAVGDSELNPGARGQVLDAVAVDHAHRT